MLVPLCSVSGLLLYEMEDCEVAGGEKVVGYKEWKVDFTLGISQSPIDVLRPYIHSCVNVRTLCNDANSTM